MSRLIFSEEELSALINNPYVETATPRRITYTDEFKRHFVEQYRIGKRPSEIFTEAGFNVDVLGYKRIERASDRWRTMNNAGRLGEQTDPVDVHQDRRRGEMSLNSLLAQQEDEIFRLRKENLELKAQLARLANA